MTKKDMLGELTAKDVKGVVSDLLEKLAGRNGQEWFSATKRFLRKQGLPTAPPAIWRVLHKHSIDTSGSDVVKIIAHSYTLHDDAQLMIHRHWPDKTHQVIVLIKVRLDDLGFKTATEYSEVVETALDLGYSLCPVETGPLLRMDYRDQPAGEHLQIVSPGMDIGGCGEDAHIFSVARDTVERRWLTMRHTPPDRNIEPKDELVFALQPKT